MEAECRKGEQATKADDDFSYVSLGGFFGEVDPNASGSVFRHFSPFTLCSLNFSSAASSSGFATQVSGVLLKASSPGILLLENLGSILKCGVRQCLLDEDSGYLCVVQVPMLHLSFHAVFSVQLSLPLLFMFTALNKAGVPKLSGGV